MQMVNKYLTYLFQNKLSDSSPVVNTEKDIVNNIEDIKNNFFFQSERRIKLI